MQSGSWKTMITSAIQAMSIRIEFCSRVPISPAESIWYDIQHFPDSLLIEILARLPVKSIFMFKSVCKHWQTLISHPSFYRFYRSILNSNAAAALPFRIMDTLPNFKEFVNCLAPEIHSSPVLFLHNPEEQLRYDKFMVLNSCYGLILCRSWSRTATVYYICDPLTRKTMIIRRRRGHQSEDFFGEGLITRVNEDHLLTGYTLVRVQDPISPSNYLNVDMFSSETGKWINYRLHCGVQIDCCRPIHCYRAIHWQVSHDGFHGMVAFDPYKDTKSVRLIPSPNDRDLHLQCECEYGGAFELYGECQGTLRYFQVACDPTKLYFLTMWAMKDYEKGEWCCEFKVRRNDVHSTNLELSNWLVDDGWFFPLSLHPLNPNVVYLICKGECIVSYDVLNRRLDVASEPIDADRSISQSSVIPCVLPSWPLLV